MASSSTIRAQIAQTEARITQARAELATAVAHGEHLEEAHAHRTKQHANAMANYEYELDKAAFLGDYRASVKVSNRFDDRLSLTHFTERHTGAIEGLQDLIEKIQALWNEKLEEQDTLREEIRRLEEQLGTLRIKLAAAKRREAEAAAAAAAALVAK